MPRSKGLLSDREYRRVRALTPNRGGLDGEVRDTVPYVRRLRRGGREPLRLCLPRVRDPEDRAVRTWGGWGRRERQAVRVRGCRAADAVLRQPRQARIHVYAVGVPLRGLRERGRA